MAVAASKGSVQSYRDLLVWQKGMDLTESCYRLTAVFPADEKYGLVSQLRRASVSVPSNIAEGFGRDNTGSFVQHLRISQGSLKEIETQLMISQRVGVAQADQVMALLSTTEELGKMLRALIRSLQQGT